MNLYGVKQDLLLVTFEHISGSVERRERIIVCVNYTSVSREH